MRTATEALAFDRYKNDIRFRQMAQAMVYNAMYEHGPVDPEKAERDAHDIALTACVNMLELVYQEDAELGRLRMERDRYRKAVETYVVSTPLPMFLRQPEPLAEQPV